MKKIKEKINIKLLSTILIALICTVILSGVALYTYLGYVKNLSDTKPQRSIVYNRDTDVSKMDCFHENDSLRQDVQVDMHGISGIVVYANISKKDTSACTVRLVELETGELVQEWNNVTSSKGKIKLKLDKEIKLQETYKMYQIYLDSKADMKNSYINVSDSDTYVYGGCYYNGIGLNGDINFEILPCKVSYKGIKYMYFILVAIMMLSFWATFILVYKKHKVETIFLCFMIAFGIVYLFVLVPYSAPDEQVHYATAYHLSNEILGVDDQDKGGFAKCRVADTNKIFDEKPGLSAYLEITNNLFEKVQDSENTGMFTIGKYVKVPKYLHMPQAIGITIARLSKMSYANTILLSEFFALMVYIIFTYMAIKVIPYGKYVLFIISAMPMTLQLATSCSYDIITMAISYLYIAYMIHLIHDETVIGVKQYICLIALTILQAPSKLIYCIFTCIIWLIPNNKFKNIKWAVSTKIILPIMAIIIGFIPNIQNVPESSNGKYIVEWADEEGYTVGYILHHIKQVVMVFVETLHSKFDFYFTSIMGTDLGWYDIHLPRYLFILLFALIVLATQTDIQQNIKINFKQRILYVGIFGAVVLLSCVTMLLSWTPLSFQYIEGVQGRYFLPALPLLLFAIMDSKRNCEQYKNLIVIGVYCINFIAIISAFEVIITR